MGLKSWLRGSKDENEDAPLLKAEPISRKRMDLLWLEPPQLAELESGVQGGGSVEARIVKAPSMQIEAVEFTAEEVAWAKRVEMIVDLAYAAGKQGRFDAAIQQYSEALKLAPGCDLFLMSIGVSYVQLGQKERGIRFLKRAAEISPGNERIRNNLAASREAS